MILPHLQKDRRRLIAKRYAEELLKHPNQLTPKEWIDAELSVLQLLDRLPFEEISIEVTPSNALKFSLRFSNNRLLMVKRPINLFGWGKTDCVYSYFENKVLTATDCIPIAQLVEAFDNYLKAPTPPHDEKCVR